MAKLKLKIYEYESESNSLIVSFGGGDHDLPTSYEERMAFQPTMYTETDDVDKVIENIARSGVFYLEQKEKEKEFKKKIELISKYKALEGKEIEFDIDELQNSQPTEIFAENSVAEEILNEILIDDLKE